MNKKNKILKIAIFYNLNFGGAKRAVYEQSKRLKTLGHPVDVYTTDQNQDIFDLSKSSDNLYRYSSHSGTYKTPFISRFINDIYTLFFLKKLHKKIANDIDDKKYDIVLVHPDKITQAPYILRYLKTRNVYYCQEPLRIVYDYNLRAKKNSGNVKYLYEILTRSVRKKIDVYNVRSAKYTIASCYHIRERMIEAYGIYPFVSYLGIDKDTFKPLNIKKKNQILFIGGKDEFSDGYDLVRKTIKLFPKNNRPDVKIISWKKNNKDRLSDESLVRVYNESLVTLCVSRMETFGLVPLESMSCGTPVVATKINGHRETVVDGCGGYLVGFSPNEILEKINKLKSDKLMSSVARRYVLDDWTWEKRAIQLEKLLMKLVDEKN